MNKREREEFNNAFYRYYSRLPKNIKRVRESNKRIINGEKPKDVVKDIDITPYVILALVLMPRPTKPILALMSMYTPKRPVLFAKKLVNIMNGYGLNKREKLAKSILDQAVKGVDYETKTLIAREIRKNEIKVNSEIFKDVINNPEKKEEIIRKYNNEKRVIRAIDTEAHEQAEYTKTKVMESLGFKYKIWRTQGDRRVRDTAWHNSVANKKVPINSDFRANGMIASHPGDVRLPIGERINCRCYLEFSRD